MLKINLNKLDDLFSLISKEKELYLPIKKDNKTEFRKYSFGEKADFESLNTLKSAKDFFFPQSENLVKFKTSGKNIEIIPEKIEEKQAVYFGIKGCDVKSFDILDLVFLADPVDIYYQAKRMGSIIISMSCNTPEETCFCTSFGIDPANSKGDATCHIVNDYLFINANTAKGKEFLNFIESVCEKCDDTDEKTVENKKEEINKIVEVLPLKSLDLTSFNEENLNEKFDSLKWEDLSKACIGCGTCTFICPTCQCYDMKDFNTGNGIQRYRCWDSCMYSDFTKMAHGNPRTTQMQKFRQRFMHKLVYFPANNNGEYSCVGCGRCLQKCPISMNIVKVAKALNEK